MLDIRDIIFQDIAEKKFRAVLIPERNGCLSGAEDAKKQAEELGVNLNLFSGEGGMHENNPYYWESI